MKTTPNMEPEFLNVSANTIHDTFNCKGDINVFINKSKCNKREGKTDSFYSTVPVTITSGDQKLGDKEEAIITFIIKKRWMDSMTASSAQYFAIKISPDCKQYIADDGCCYDYHVTRLMCITKPDAVSKLKELESSKVSLDEFDQDIF